MPKEIPAVQCENCEKLIPTTGKYITVVAEIRAKLDDSESQWNKQNAPKAIHVDAIVCGNGCLSELLSLKGF